MLAACLQLQVNPCQPEINTKKSLEMAEKAIFRGTEILVFPELFLTGFCYEPLVNDSTTISSLKPFHALAKKFDCLIIGSIKRGRLNMGFCLDTNGVKLRPKIHPFCEEKEHFDGGDFISPMPTKKGMVGLEICYDLRFPEVARSLTLQGSDFLVTIAAFPSKRRDQWRALCIARAIENQLPHIACNCAGYGLAGNSMIIDALGVIQAEAGDEQTLITGKIDLKLRDLVRDEIPCLADRRPDVY